MLKSRYSDPRFNDHGFVNHIHSVMKDMGVYPDGSRLVECYKIMMVQNLQAAAGGGAKPRNLALFRKVLSPNAAPESGTWDLLKMWQEGVDYDDASAAGSVDVDITTGMIHIVMSFGKFNGSGALTFQTWEASMPRSFAPPIVRPSVGGTQGPKGDPGPQGPMGPQGPKGDPGASDTGGGLDPQDRKLLDRLRAFLSPLLGLDA